MDVSILHRMAAEIAEVVSQHTGESADHIRLKMTGSKRVDRHLVSIAMYDKDDTRLFAVNVDLQESSK